MKDFLDQSYNVDLLGGDRVSYEAWQNSFYVAISASAHAALRCVTASLEDFRGNLATISIPVLVIQGVQDRVLPYEATGGRLPALLKNTRSIVIAGGPHAVIWTDADEVNQALLDFIGHPGQAGTRHSRPENRPQSESETDGPADPDGDRVTAALPPGGSRSASAGGERVVDVEVVGGAVRGDGHAVPGQQRVVVDDREVGRW